MTNTTERTKMREARLRKGWTQAKLASVVTATGVETSYTTIYRVESGTSTPRPQLRAALADVLGLDPVADL